MRHKRILVIGCPGSGKSTFSRALADLTALPLCHLDMLYWNGDKTTVSNEEFLARLRAVLAQDAWIIDGNYASTLDERLQRCDAVFLLDYPVETCLDGILARRWKPRRDMPWIETETDPAFMDFVRRFPEDTLPLMLEALNRYPGKEIILFHTRREADQYLQKQQQDAFH